MTIAPSTSQAAVAARPRLLLLALLLTAAGASRCAAGESAGGAPPGAAPPAVVTTPAAAAGAPAAFAADAADAAPAATAHQPAQVLRPIASALSALDLRAFEAMPVQHGGRYKPMHALAMEIIDGLGGAATLGHGHTPLSSLLDLLFCNSAYLDQPIVTIKHSELCHDLAAAVPEAERDALRKGHISPRRLDDEGVQAAIETLSRQTTKTKAINQIRRAHSVCDTRNLASQLHILALPAGPHSDRWRDPMDSAGEFADALSAVLRLAGNVHGAGAGRTATADAGEEDADRFASLTWNPLPLTAETAARLGLNADDMQRLNHDVLWPLWQAAAAGKLTGVAGSDVAGLVAHAGLSGEAAIQVSEGLHQLAASWPRLGVADEDVAQPAERAPVSAALGRASAAWTALGAAWADWRLGVGSAAVVQQQVDALVAAAHEIIGLDNRDRAERGQPALRLDTDLELTYWRLNGFSGVAWLFLCAVPLLALGAIGRARLPLRLGYLLFALGLGGQLAAFIIRGILAQRIPLANLYESMAAASLLCSLVAVAGELILWWRARARSPAPAAVAVAGDASGAAPPLALTLASAGQAARAPLPGSGAQGSLALGAALFGCVVVTAQVFLEYHDINAFISPQMPILSEFWLRVHTSCVVSSYGLISLGGLMSLVYLAMRTVLPWHDARCQAWDRTTFAINAIATVVLWVGLCLGAVWAAQSWGRPWGWDPKEVFALLTWVVFIMLVHLRAAVSPARRGLATALVSVAAFLVMAFNWYVVNVVLAGLHSYA
jgi:ABC-type transport system involved in cytochrome c biogenesis permease subunit